MKICNVHMCTLTQGIRKRHQTKFLTEMLQLHILEMDQSKKYVKDESQS